MDLEEIGKQLIMYAKFGSRYVSIWNPFFKRWEVKLHFKNGLERHRWWNTIGDKQKATLSDTPYQEPGE